MENVWTRGDKKLLVAGHRGACALYPENTMLSFEKAIEMGVDGLETDVWMSSDGRLVLMHDGNVSRTTDGEGDIRTMTFDEIKRLDAGCKCKGGAVAGARVPAFEEFLELTKDRPLMLNIEIKDGREEVVDRVMAELVRYNIGDRFLINSWNGGITTYAHRKYGVKTHGYPKSYYKTFKPEYYEGMYSVGINMRDLTKELCDEFFALGIEPWCWCPDDEAAVGRAISCGAVLATVNDPRAALRLR